ncbi:MAG: helix-turn-helix transcriptional regulator, partial [Oscillospiraceae bacterium]|nr:helix-turn-helix transcriptional regulator [Oscillospiraceae bacterium]
KLLNVSETVISKYESDVVNPSLDTLCNIASIFNVSMDTLCGMKEQGKLSTHGLTEAQTDTLRALADVYRSKGVHPGSRLTQEQYAVLGQILAEMMK